MGLAQYKKKRDFTRTPEPKAEAKQRGSAQRAAAFVVQKHAASRLHFDIRLEHGGVLKSWASPKGPSLNPADRRLAVQVEDHPIAYGAFEGTIPNGEYGGGTVMLWDRGTWAPLPGESVAAGLRKGRLKFTLRGKRLRGAWMLLRLKEEGEKRNWLLIKENDEFSRDEGAAIVDEEVVSIASGRTMGQIAQGGSMRRSDRGARSRGAGAGAPREVTLDARSLPGARRAAMPEAVAPQLAQIAPEIPGGDRWTHEIKFDGYRIIALCEGESVTLLSRNGLRWTARFPEIARALAERALPGAALDGEVVALREDGVSDFLGLQAALKTGATQSLVYMVFDALWWGGCDLRGCALEDRRRALRAALARGGDAVRISQGLEGRGEEILPLACRLGLEGIVSKRLSSTYTAGRSGAWLKIRCGKRQEFVVGGMTAPRNSRSGFGALLIGAHNTDGKLIYAGRVGSGFDDADLKSIEATLRRRPAGRSPFADLQRGPEARGARWTEPEMVVEVSYTGWTADRLLRHPVFQGVREDKPAREVVFETETQVAAQRAEPGAEATMPKKRTSKKAGARKRAALPETKPAPAVSDGPNLGVAITHPERVVYPVAGVTKREVAEYYAAVAEWMMPHARLRPLSIVRCPGGAGAKCFFHKHVDVSAAVGLRAVPVEESDGVADHAALTGPEGLVYLAQMNALELHAWGARTDDITKPDRLVIDLDPGEGVLWPEIVDGARGVREALRSLGLESFVKTTGGKGLHVVAPVRRGITWTQAKALTKSVAIAVSEASPGKFVVVMSKAARKGRVFIDYLRNDYGATSVLAFSTRAGPGATVSMPVEWDELNDTENAAYTVRTAIEHLRRRKRDPWQDLPRTHQGVASAVLRRLETARDR